MLPYSETLLSALFEFELRILESVADWLLLKGDEDFSPPANVSEVGVVGASTTGTKNNGKHMFY